MLKKDVTKKMLVEIAGALNKVMGYEKPIDTGRKVLRKDLYDEVADSAQDIEPADLENEAFTDDIVTWLKVMGWESPNEPGGKKIEEIEQEPTEPEDAPEPTVEENPPPAKEKAEPKPKKKAPTKKAPAKKEKKDAGVIASILEFVTKFGPITKDEVVLKLSERFTDRDPVAMAKTVQAQLPKRMSKEKGINIVAGFYIK